MSYNQKMFGLGSKRSIIREIFEYSKTRAAEIGADKVFDFSLGNPSVPAPAEVNATIAELLATEDSVLLQSCLQPRIRCCCTATPRLRATPRCAA